MSSGRRRVRVAAGLALLGIGAVGTLLPALPGIPLMVAGMAVLGPDHPWSRAITNRLRRWRARFAKAPAMKRPTCDVTERTELVDIVD